MSEVTLSSWRAWRSAIHRALPALCIAIASFTIAPPAKAATAQAGPAAALRARHAALAAALDRSPFGQRLLLESIESPHALQGDIYAVVDYALPGVTSVVTSPQRWCDALILHPNVKYCRPRSRADGAALSVAIGRKVDQPLEDAYRVEFAFTTAASATDYVAADLRADKGPLGTTGYQITLEAVALESGRSFVHLRYSYQFGLEARLAMEAYLATGGREKVGFTRADAAGEREPKYIGGLRAALERNTMRYYLAIDACLATLGAPPAQRFEQSLEHWYASSERYARQLHDVDRPAYIAMKRREYARQQAAD